MPSYNLDLTEHETFKLKLLWWRRRVLPPGLSAVRFEFQRHRLATPLGNTPLRRSLTQSPSGDWEQISISLRAMPSFEAVGRWFEAADPFTLWVQAARLVWMPWLLAGEALMQPEGRPRALPGAVRPQQEGPTPGGA